MNQPEKILVIATLLFSFEFHVSAQNRSSLSMSFGNAPVDFKVGWYEIDNESFDNHDVEQLSFSAGLKYQQQVRDNKSFRIRTGYSRVNLYEYGNESGSFTSAESKQIKLQLAPGFTFSISEKGFSVFGGFELPLCFHGKVQTEFIHRIDAVSFNEHNSSIIPSGFTAGIAPLMGFVCHFSKRFFCETEFSTLCLYGKMGGKTTATYNDYVVTTQDVLKGIFFEPRVALGLGVKF